MHHKHRRTSEIIAEASKATDITSFFELWNEIIASKHFRLRQELDEARERFQEYIFKIRVDETIKAKLFVYLEEKRICPVIEFVAMPSNTMDETILPEVNEVAQRSAAHRAFLHLAISQAIETQEKQHNYKFESYEIDLVLLTIVRNRHEQYITSKFGYPYKK